MNRLLKTPKKDAITITTNLMTVRTNGARTDACSFHFLSILFHGLLKRGNISITHLIIKEIII